MFSLFEAWLVAAAGVEDEGAEEFSGLGVDDSDVEVVDDEGDVGSFVGSSDSDVVHASGLAEADGSCLVDAVIADEVVGAGVLVVGLVFG